MGDGEGGGWGKQLSTPRKKEALFFKQPSLDSPWKRKNQAEHNLWNPTLQVLVQLPATSSPHKEPEALGKDALHNFFTGALTGSSHRIGC